ncbi:serine/threonine protein kinase, partial [Myxococcota bacterium]|nr:serine/threonine protein kinase [Myxococcota bacterium]
MDTGAALSAVGDKLGRYTLLRRLAGGGMGEVYLAAIEGPAGFGKPVALKVLRPEFASDATFVAMLIDEAKISQFLNHQNIVSVLDFADDAGTYFLAMEFVQGVTVEQLIDLARAKQRRIELPLGLYVGIELCRALKYAHGRTNELGEPLNIVHRDVTPANVLLSVQGEVKLTDFGIARAKGRMHQTQAGVVKGKFGYLAPEMTRYEQIDARADLFSLGVLLYQLCAGIHPVAGASVMEAIFRFEEKQLKKPSEHNPEVTGSLDAVVMRALEPKPANRWASAQALGAALQDVAMSRPEWRRGLQQAPHLLSSLIRELAPEADRDPVAVAREAAQGTWGQPQ